MRKAPYFKYYLVSDLLERPIPIYQDESGSDVSDETLLKAGKSIPLTPTVETWKRLTEKKLKCHRCFASIVSRIDDRAYHMQVAHQVSA